jgi:6,7-dimethyl-8-ribityllumazine synthase
MELVHGANTLLSNDTIDGVITLGCIIKGETDHDKYIASAVANGLVSVSLKYNKPVIFGVLTTNTVSQALDRCGGKYGNKGTESADTLLSILKLS